MDWSTIDWQMVGSQGVLVFLSAFIANLFVVLIGDTRVVAAILAALIFCALLIGWTHIPWGFRVSRDSAVCPPLHGFRASIHSGNWCACVLPDSIISTTMPVRLCRESFMARFPVLRRCLSSAVVRAFEEALRTRNRSSDNEGYSKLGAPTSLDSVWGRSRMLAGACFCGASSGAAWPCANLAGLAFKPRMPPRRGSSSRECIPCTCAGSVVHQLSRFGR